MMVGGTFIQPKAGRPRPESAKQSEIRLAILLKMLQIAHFGTEASLGAKRRSDGLFIAISAGYGCCYLVHSFYRAIGAVLCKQVWKKDYASLYVYDSIG
jgi:hypothetical protein